MNRRHFLRALLALPIAATLDVEQLLWIPGQMVTVPALPPLYQLSPLLRQGDIFTIAGHYVMNPWTREPIEPHRPRLWVITGEHGEARPA